MIIFKNLNSVKNLLKWQFFGFRQAFHIYFLSPVAAENDWPFSPAELLKSTLQCQVLKEIGRIFMNASGSLCPNFQ